MAIFFVNQSKTYKEERNGSYLWSPKLNRRGMHNYGYDLMEEVKKGDFIIHNAGRQLTAISEVEEDCQSQDKPKTLNDETNEWDNDGWMISAKYFEFSSPLPTADIKEWMKENPQDDGAFIKKTGSPKQQRLCRLTDDQARYIFNFLLRNEKNEKAKEVINAALCQLPSQSCI